MRSDMSLKIAGLLEGLRASDERTDKVTFQICLKYEGEGKHLQRTAS
jgi:hypothetical protein